MTALKSQIRLEWLFFWRTGTPLAILLAVTACLATSLIIGHRVTEVATAITQRAESDQRELYKATAQEVKNAYAIRHAQGLNDDVMLRPIPSPEGVESRLFPFHAEIPPGSLALLHVAGSTSPPSGFDYHVGARFAQMQRIAPDTLLSGLFPESKLQNPTRSAFGQFDFVFVCTYLFPLFVLLCFHDVVSQPRSSGVLALAIAQAGDRWTWLKARILVRGLFATCVLVLLPLCLIVLFTRRFDPASLSALGYLLLALLLYVSIWAGVGTICSIRSSTPRASALTACASWLLLTLIIPSIVSLALPALLPTSQEEFISSERAASLAINPQLDELQAAANDKLRTLPRSAPGESVPYYAQAFDMPGQEEILRPFIEHDRRWNGPLTASRFFRAVSDARTFLITNRTAAPLRKLDQRERQVRTASDIAAIVSPSLLIDGLLHQLDGDSIERRSDFLRQLYQFVNGRQAFFTDKIVATKNIRDNDLDSLQPFHFQEPSASIVFTRVAWPLAGLLLFVLTTIVLAERALMKDW